MNGFPCADFLWDSGVVDVFCLIFVIPSSYL